MIASIRNGQKTDATTKKLDINTDITTTAATKAAAAATKADVAASKADLVAAKIDAVTAKIEAVHEATNGLQGQLLDATKAASFAEGAKSVLDYIPLVRPQEKPKSE